MYKLIIDAKDLQEMREKLLYSYESIKSERERSQQLEFKEAFKDSNFTPPQAPIMLRPTVPPPDSLIYPPAGPPNFTKAHPIEYDESEDDDLTSKVTSTRTASETLKIEKQISDGEIAFDSRGIRWNAEIHSSSKGLNKDGSWRTRRNVDAKTVSKVEAASIPVVSSPVVAPAVAFISPPSPTVIAVPPPLPTVIAVPSIPTSVPIAAIAAPIATPEIAPLPQFDAFAATRKQAHDFASFKATLIPSLAKLVDDGRLTPSYINDLKTYFKVKEIWQVDDNQLGEMFEQFAGAGLINKVGQ